MSTTQTYTKKDDYDLFTALAHAANGLGEVDRYDSYKQNIFITRDFIAGNNDRKIHHSKIKSGIKAGNYLVKKLTKTKIELEYQNIKINRPYMGYHELEKGFYIKNFSRIECEKDSIHINFCNVVSKSNAVFSFNHFQKATEYMNDYTALVKDSISPVILKGGNLSAIIMYMSARKKY